VLEQLQALGLQVLEAYGLSENIVPVALNRLDDYQAGTVGRVLAPNEITIADDGEILVRGSGVFHGYLNAASTTPAVDAEGYLHTGDLGELDAQGYLRLRGHSQYEITHFAGEFGKALKLVKTTTGGGAAPTNLQRFGNDDREIRKYNVRAEAAFLDAVYQASRGGLCFSAS
jgi:acyl-CoA synthetase (AMP-forming)/AMP-acid ligase II